MRPDRVGGRRALVYAAFAVLLAFQVFLGLWGVADQWTRGHNGWNGAAYHNGARNTLRWGELFPLQYETANVPPRKDQLYTHAPLALHLHNVASVRIFGDRELSIRLVAAFWSVAAFCMLFAVARRLWSDAHGLLAAGVYVALPINAIYTNMANHSAGFIFWALLTLYLYVRSRDMPSWRGHSFVLFLAAFTMAATWDWPAYYIALCICLHWASTLWRKEREAGASLQLGVFCGWVLLLFIGHLVLVEWLTGNLDELTGTFNARRALSWQRFRTHLLTVPDLMFTAPILALSGGWLVAWGARLTRSQTEARDLVPIAFLIAGLAHYLTFRWSAIVHSYWAWPMLPFVSIAVATSLLAIGHSIETRVNRALERHTSIRARARLARAASLAVAIFLVPLAIRDAQIVPQGRHVGGSMWFFTPVRGAVHTYDSGRAELRFAERVRAWTARDTGVQLHPSLRSRRLEPRFDITLDRATHRWSPTPRLKITNDQGVDGWVFIARVEEVAETERVDLAARYPYRQFGQYFMVDLRGKGTDIEVWKVTPKAMSPRWWLFHSAFEPPVVAFRSAVEEASLYEKVGKHRVE
ncbi:MAG: glycosyltransferase family 39 protein [Myxococcales bacterium]|nr:glycosyltransferase family 39 protein [Myxococcales bacterium]MDH3483633.1 glycosyltransferase family 39 protein [Myxococcales bacterium]